MILKLHIHVYIFIQKHIDYIHPESGEKKFFCDHCDKGYIFEPTLYYHKWSRHNSDQKHMCDICGKEYNNKVRINGLKVWQWPKK